MTPPYNLQVKWGNQRKLPYDGWVEIEVSFVEDKEKAVTVPFLVTSETLEFPILGTNAIEHLSSSFNPDELNRILKNCLPHQSPHSINPLIHLLHSQNDAPMSSVTSPKKVTVVPAGTVCHIKCSIERHTLDSRIPVAFEPEEAEMWDDVLPLQATVMMKKGNQNYIKVPVFNNSNHDAVLPSKTILGQYIRFNPLPLWRQLR